MAKIYQNISDENGIVKFIKGCGPNVRSVISFLEVNLNAI